MKKILSILLICVLSFMLIACSGTDTKEKTNKKDKATEVESTEENNAKEEAKKTEKTEKSAEEEKETEQAEEKTEETEKDVEEVKETEKADEKTEETEKDTEEVKETESEENSEKDAEEDSGTASETKFEGPFIITTCGQSPGAVQIGMAAKMAGTSADDDSGLTADTLDTEKYKTLIVTTGTSMKGMGAAGTDVNKEIERCVDLIKKAQDAGMNVIGAHVEGMSRRMDSSDEKSIDAIMELVDTILIVESSNEDGFFTKYAEENSKVLVEVKDAIAVGEVLK